MRLIIVTAFVILTNPSLWSKGPKYTFIPETVKTVDFNPKDCRHFDDTGVGCTQAVLTFESMSSHKKVLPETMEVIFSPGGKWEMTLFYHPTKCREMGKDGGTGVVRFLCSEVSWRTAK